MKKFTTITLLLLITTLLSGCFALAEPEGSSGAVAAPTLETLEQPPVALENIEADDAYPAEEPSSEEAAPMEESTNSEPYPAEEAPPPVAEPYPANEPLDEPDQPQPPQEYPAGADAYPAQEAGAGDTPSEEAAVEETTTAETETAAEAPPDAGAEVSGDLPIYEIDPARSEARFSIKEVLRGQPTTVVGVSRNLGGQIGFDLDDPTSAQVGTILINARDFATDNEFRNNAIANEILLTDDYEFITFEPLSISGLPQTAEIGRTYAIQIGGILGITDATREVTFDAQVTPLSEDELAGLAAVEILYADFGLTIPFARSVESVEDNVLLELDFVAARE